MSYLFLGGLSCLLLRKLDIYFLSMKEKIKIIPLFMKFFLITFLELIDYLKKNP
uniref:Uncharacterized protein n=1 Tax=Saccharolobus islandicus TaxID=43080 RepID=Q0ZNR3_SACIS|nr:hypothetical protein [Sulfolobus islandicus]